MLSHFQILLVVMLSRKATYTK